MAPKPPKPFNRPSSPRFRERRIGKSALPPEIENLRTLSRQIPNGLAAYNILMDLDSPIDKPARRDRYSALVGAALLEYALKAAISKHLAPGKSKGAARLIFDDYDRSPLASFSARIKMAYALGIVDKTTMDNLIILKNVRNDFAHSVEEFGLASAECAIKLNQLKPQVRAHSAMWSKYSPRHKVVWHIIHLLLCAHWI